MEPFLRQEIIEVVARDTAWNSRITRPNLTRVTVAKLLKSRVNLSFPAAGPDDLSQFRLTRFADRESRAVVKQDLEFMDLVGGSSCPQAHQRVDTARIVANHPADRAVGMRGRVGGQRQAMFLG